MQTCIPMETISECSERWKKSLKGGRRQDRHIKKGVSCNSTIRESKSVKQLRSLNRYVIFFRRESWLMAFNILERKDQSNHIGKINANT